MPGKLLLTVDDVVLLSSQVVQYSLVEFPDCQLYVCIVLEVAVGLVKCFADVDNS